MQNILIILPLIIILQISIFLQTSITLKFLVCVLTFFKNSCTYFQISSVHKNGNATAPDGYTFIPPAAVAAAYLSSYSTQYMQSNSSAYADTSFFLGQQGM